MRLLLRWVGGEWQLFAWQISDNFFRFKATFEFELCCNFSKLGKLWGVKSQFVILFIIFVRSFFEKEPNKRFSKTSLDFQASENSENFGNNKLTVFDNLNLKVTKTVKIIFVEKVSKGKKGSFAHFSHKNDLTVFVIFKFESSKTVN